MFKVIAAVAILCSAFVISVAGRPPSHEIIDVEADIRDLDVGDLNDMESDVPHQFSDSLKQQNWKMPSLGDMKNPTDWATNLASGTQMTFASLTMQKAEELGKEGTDSLAGVWKSMLQLGGVEATCYAVDAGKVLFVTNGPGLVGMVKDFVLAQPEVDWFEYQQKMFFPDGRKTPLMGIKERKQREIELGWRKESSSPEVKKGEPRKKRRKRRQGDL